MHRSADAVLVKGEKRYYFAKLTLFAPFALSLWSYILYFNQLCYCHVPGLPLP
jgi:hypothetical protein